MLPIYDATDRCNFTAIVSARVQCSRTVAYVAYSFSCDRLMLCILATICWTANVSILFREYNIP